MRHDYKYLLGQYSTINSTCFNTSLLRRQSFWVLLMRPTKQVDRWSCTLHWAHSVHCTTRNCTAEQNCAFKRCCYVPNSLHGVASKLVWGISEQAEKNCIATWSIHAVPKGHKPCKNATWPPRDVTARTVFSLPLHSCMHTTGCLNSNIRCQITVAQWQ